MSCCFLIFCSLLLLVFSLFYQPDLITFFSFKFFIELIEGYPIPFALNYSFGNLLSLSSMTFLCGPKKQFQKMFDEKRKLTSITYLSCLVATLACVFIPLPGFLRLILLVFLLLAQFCACFWYSLSYIPFGRRWALKCIKRQLGMSESTEFLLGELPWSRSSEET